LLTFCPLTKASKQSPPLFLPYLDIFACFTGSGMTEAMLEPHMKNDAGANQAEVALAFFCLGAAYLIIMPTVGYVSILINVPL